MKLVDRLVVELEPEQRANDVLVRRERSDDRNGRSSVGGFRVGVAGLCIEHKAALRNGDSLA